MKIQQTSLNFGMALFMPSEQEIASELGERPAKRIETARAALSELAQDVDIYIKPSADGQARNELGSIYIDVRKLNTPPKKPSFFCRLFNIKPSPETLQKYREIVYHKDIAERIIKKTTDLKNKVITIR